MNTVVGELIKMKLSNHKKTAIRHHGRDVKNCARLLWLLLEARRLQPC